MVIGAAGAGVPAPERRRRRCGPARPEEREERHWGAFFLGLLVGAAAGAIVALLTAPQRGEEMRRELGERAEEIATKAKEEWVPIFQRATNGAGDALDETGDRASAEDASAADRRRPPMPATRLGDAGEEARHRETADAINDAYDAVDRESPA